VIYELLILPSSASKIEIILEMD